jgi:hypothetical protein
MTSQPIRDQVDDHLLTPKNSALLIIYDSTYTDQQELVGQLENV